MLGALTAEQALLAFFELGILVMAGWYFKRYCKCIGEQLGIIIFAAILSNSLWTGTSTELVRGLFSWWVCISFGLFAAWLHRHHEREQQELRALRAARLFARL